jgi:hypothetical protein
VALQLCNTTHTAARYEVAHFDLLRRRVLRVAKEFKYKQFDTYTHTESEREREGLSAQW